MLASFAPANAVPLLTAAGRVALNSLLLALHKEPAGRSSTQAAGLYPRAEIVVLSPLGWVLCARKLDFAGSLGAGLEGHLATRLRPHDL
jgi:hypothetical protein